MPSASRNPVPAARPTVHAGYWSDTNCSSAAKCYGSVAGGFLSERWLGASEPAQPLEIRSLVKYELIIDDFDGWDLLQHLLAQLQRIARRHGVSIPTVAMHRGTWARFKNLREVPFLQGRPPAFLP